MRSSDQPGASRGKRITGAIAPHVTSSAGWFVTSTRTGRGSPNCVAHPFRRCSPAIAGRCRTRTEPRQPQRAEQQNREADRRAGRPRHECELRPVRRARRLSRPDPASTSWKATLVSTTGSGADRLGCPGDRRHRQRGHDLFHHRLRGSDRQRRREHPVAQRRGLLSQQPERGESDGQEDR